MKKMRVLSISVDRQDLDDYYNDTINGIDPFSDVDAVIYEEQEKEREEIMQALADEVVHRIRDGGRNAR
jgi:hypothetical protein